MGGGCRGSTPYSEWVLSAVARRSEVTGEFSLGSDRHGRPLDMAAVLDGMVRWWEARTVQTRLDCAMARANDNPGAEDCGACHEPCCDDAA